MHPKIVDLVDQCCDMKLFLRKELKMDISESEAKTLKQALRMLKKRVNDLRKLQKTFETSTNFVFRVHCRRRLDLQEFEKNVENQKKKIEQIVGCIVSGYLFNTVNN